MEGFLTAVIFVILGCFIGGTMVYQVSLESKAKEQCILKIEHRNQKYTDEYCQHWEEIWKAN